MNTPPTHPYVLDLSAVLRRDDTWMGHSQVFSKRAACNTGYPGLNAELLNEGWPLASLVEICQPGIQCDLHLFTPAIANMKGLIILLNPPATPFCQAFIQAGINLDRLVVVKAPEKNQFIACFIEMARANVDAVLSWQPKDALTYTELRKCLLAASDGTGLHVMFRPANAQQQSSPASLRLFTQMVADGLEITIFKQKGQLLTHQSRPVLIGLPARWTSAVKYRLLGQKPPRSIPALPALPTVSHLPRRGQS